MWKGSTFYNSVFLACYYVIGGFVLSSLRGQITIHDSSSRFVLCIFSEGRRLDALDEHGRWWTFLHEEKSLS